MSLDILSSLSKTVIDIDRELVEAARKELSTITIKETVRRALSEVVAMAARRRLVEQLKNQDGIDLSGPHVLRNEGWR
ncbi:MAG: hypothetical protein ACREN8_13755 [Candidatus Dormibacteraceae bacterium]